MTPKPRFPPAQSELEHIAAASLRAPWHGASGVMEKDAEGPAGQDPHLEIQARPLWAGLCQNGVGSRRGTHSPAPKELRVS